MGIIEILDVLTQDFALRALFASCLVGVTCGILGCFIVLRNMALIGDALSHAILPGVVVGFVVAGQSVLAFFTGAVAAGLFTAAAITWIQQNFKARDDSAVGVVFSAMFSIGVIGLSQITREEGVHLDLKDFLFGNVLGVTNQDLVLTSIVTLYVLVSVSVFYRYLMTTTFQSVASKAFGISTQTVHYFLMLLLSFTVVSSLQSVGVILVVAMLVTPASTALLLTQKLHFALVWAAGLGMLSSALGLIIAIAGNFPPGPVMTLVATTFYILAALFRPERGLAIVAWRKDQKKKQILTEDILKACVIIYENHRIQPNESHKNPSVIAPKCNCTIENIAQKAHIEIADVLKGLKNLITQGLVEKKISDQGEIIWHPTPKGIEAAYRLIRAHRVWETYLTQEMGQDTAHVHLTAERFEHHLPDEFITEIEQKLGNPLVDPHGSPIPKNNHKNTLTLSELSLKQKAVVIIQQPNIEVSLKLWNLGVTPNQPICILKFPETTFEKEGNIEIEISGNTIQFPFTLAQNTLVSLL